MGKWGLLRSIASWLLGLFRATQDLFFLFTLFGALGVGALVIGILPELADISSGSAILIGVGVALLSLPLLFPVVALLLSLAGSRSPAMVPVPEPEPEPLPEPDVSGETRVNQVWERGIASVALHEPDKIDYHPTDWVYNEYIIPSQEVKALGTLKLGEMALIRRLAIAPDQRQPSRRGDAVLHASGITHSGTSIASLERLGLVQATDDEISLTELGRRLVWLSSQVLMHSGDLVVAYRRVTPRINETVRFDGRT